MLSTIDELLFSVKCESRNDLSTGELSAIYIQVEANEWTKS